MGGTYLVAGFWLLNDGARSAVSPRILLPGSAGFREGTFDSITHGELRELFTERSRTKNRVRGDPNLGQSLYSPYSPLFSTPLFDQAFHSHFRLLLFFPDFARGLPSAASKFAHQTASQCITTRSVPFPVPFRSARFRSCRVLSPPRDAACVRAIQAAPFRSNDTHRAPSMNRTRDSARSSLGNYANDPRSRPVTERSRARCIEALFANGSARGKVGSRGFEVYGTRAIAHGEVSV